MNRSRPLIFAFGWLFMVAAMTELAHAQQNPSMLIVKPAGDHKVLVWREMAGNSQTDLAIQTTDGAISDARLVQVPAPAASTAAAQGLQIALWKETPTGGTSQSYYSVRIDANHFSDPRPADYRVKLRGSEFDPMVNPPFAPVENGHEKDAAATALYIVQFVSPPTDALVQPLRDLGAQPHVYLPEYCQIVEMTEPQRDQVAAMPQVRWVGPFDVRYKLDESLRGLVDVQGQAEKNGGAPGRGKSPSAKYWIMMFQRGPAAQQIVSERVLAAGGAVNTRIAEGYRILATLNDQQVLQLANMNQVQFIEPWGPPSVDMDIARQIGGAVPLLSGLGITGQGVRGEVMDEYFHPTHLAFANPTVILHGPNPGDSSGHGTSTYGIVFGNGAGNINGTGMLPDREQGFFATFHQLSSWPPGTVSRYAITADLVNPNGPYRCVFQSNSWGSTQKTVYDTTSAELDDILFQDDLLLCQSQSNSGTQFSRPEAWAKNCVSVGGVTHQNTLTRTDDTWTAASFGPAADGRIKPDLTHFYDNVLCPSNANDTDYTPGFNGTSAATPIVCGYFGLVFQLWHEQAFSGFGGGASVFDDRPHMTTAKALVINSSYRYNWLAGGANGNLTRAKQGWGMPDLAKLYNDRTKTFIVNETDLLAPFGSKSYQFQVAAGTPEFRATMVYADPMGNPNASVARVNDLSMKVVAPGGAFYWGNNGLNAGNFSTSGGTSNTVDTVENVFIQNPAAGTWTVTIYGDAIVADGHTETPQTDADYALVVAGVTFISPCPADITHDNAVNVSDLLTVINAWGSCAGCPADINHDGQVNVNDLLAVINGWGACP